MSQKTLTESLMKEKRLKLLQHFVNNQEEHYTLKEISDSTNTSYKTVKDTVEQLKNYGFLEVEEKGNYNIITVNKDSPYLEVFKQIGELDSKPFLETADKFAETLEERYRENIDSIILFGSVAKGIPTSESDIDLLILAENEESKEKINDEAWSLRDKFMREEKIEFSPLVFTTEEFKREIRNQSPLENRIVREGEILIGDLPDDIKNS